MKTLFSTKGMCAFKEEGGAFNDNPFLTERDVCIQWRMWHPSPCFPIKGGGEPHFWVFTFWKGETLPLSYLNPFIPPFSSRVRVRAFVVARVLASSWCSCSVVDARCSSFSTFVVFVFVCTCACELGVCYLTNFSSPIPQYHFIFLLSSILIVWACVLLESLPF